MWRSFALAIGFYMLLVGGQCLGVQKFTLKKREPQKIIQKTGILDERQVKPGGKRVLEPAPWVPWSLLSTGAVVCLYSFTLPRRWSN